MARPTLVAASYSTSSQSSKGSSFAPSSVRSRPSYYDKYRSISDELAKNNKRHPLKASTRPKSALTRPTLRETYINKVKMADTLPAKLPTAKATPTTPTKKKPTPANSANKTKAKNDEAFANLQNDLQRYARVNDRRSVMRAVNECRQLRSIAIDSSPSAPTNQEEWKSLEREVRFTSVELNGLVFPASSSSQILKVLQELCNELCKNHNSNGNSSRAALNPTSIYQAMVVRLARTTSSADAYFQLNALLGNRELVLQPRAASTPATTLMMYESGQGAIHINLTTHHPYGLFRRCDVTSHKAWIPLQASIHERVNFLTGDCFRRVGVEVVPDS